VEVSSWADKPFILYSKTYFYEQNTREMASFYGFAKTEKAACSQRLHAAFKAGIC
jgi:hypothetical protein